MSKKHLVSDRTDVTGALYSYSTPSGLISYINFLVKEYGEGSLQLGSISKSKYIFWDFEREENERECSLRLERELRQRKITEIEQAQITLDKLRMDLSIMEELK